MNRYQSVMRPRWAADGGNGSVVTMDELEMDTDTRSELAKAFEAYELVAGLTLASKLRVIDWLILDLRADAEAGTIKEQ